MSEDLIAELKSAKEGNRDLSDKVLLACGWETGKQLSSTGAEEPFDVWVPLDKTARHIRDGDQPDPTRDLYATLAWVVPEGWGWNLLVEWRGTATDNPHQLCTAGVRSPDALYREAGPHQGGDYTREFIKGTDGHAIQVADPILALCIAALKARMASNALS